MSLCLPTDFPLRSREITNDFKKGKHKNKIEKRNDAGWLILGWLSWSKLSGQIAPGGLRLNSSEAFSVSACASMGQRCKEAGSGKGGLKR